MERQNPFPPALDGLSAWQNAARMVTANREMLMAIAGVFFMLPALLFAVMVPQPDLPQGLTGKAAFEALSDYYGAASPYLLVVTVLQLAGMLAVLIVMTDRTRPTVGQAIGRGFRGSLPYLVAQLLYGLALGVGLGIVLALGSLTGISAVAAALIIIAGAFAINVFLRLLLIAPVLAVEGERNPLAAIRQSWRLTRGQVWRMGAFFGLALVLFLVVSSLIMMFVGIVLALVTQGDLQRVLADAVSSAITAVALVYFAGMLAAVHQQLSQQD